MIETTLQARIDAKARSDAQAADKLRAYAEDCRGRAVAATERSDALAAQWQRGPDSTVYRDARAALDESDLLEAEADFAETTANEVVAAANIRYDAPRKLLADVRFAIASIEQLTRNAAITKLQGRADDLHQRSLGQSWTALGAKMTELLRVSAGLGIEVSDIDVDEWLDATRQQVHREMAA